MHFDLEVISKALQMLLDAVLPVVAGFAAAFLKAKFEEARASLSQTQQAQLDGFVKIAVFAAEQMNLAGEIDSKLDYADGVLQSYLDKAGLSISVEDRRALIESAVHENFNYSG